jgi:hypothetical protein
MKYIEREIRRSGNEGVLAYYHAHWTRAGAPLLDLLGAVIDHAEPFAAGGTDDIENLLTACNRCNGRKSDSERERWDGRPKEKPVKGKYGEPQNWDGLSALFVLMAGRDGTYLTRNEKEWLKALLALQ